MELNADELQAITAPPTMTFEAFQKWLKNNKSILKYDSADEPKIPHPWWTLDHPKIQEELKMLSNSTISQMSTVPDGDIEIKHLLEQGKSVYKIQKAAIRTIAVSGRQGDGKSSFLNAILDCPGLSLVAADGRACTSTIIRYFHYQGSTDSRFVAEIVFLGTKMRQDLINYHANAYYHYNHFDDELAEMPPESAIEHGSRSPDESDAIAKDTAIDVFETLFGGHQQFLDEWSPQAYRNGSYQKLCARKCEEALSKLDTNYDHIKFCAAPTPAGLAKIIEPFVTKVEGAISLWPLVDCVRYGLDSELLKQGYEIIDLPGWGDISTARQRQADEIRDSVDIEIILADTKRILTDAAVIQHGRAGLLNRGASGVLVVANKIDSRNESDFSRCHGAGFDEINDLFAWVDRTSEEMDLGGDNENENISVRIENMQKKEDLIKYRTYLERQRKCLKIVQRAQNIDQELPKKFKELLGKTSLCIFHTSAAQYLDWINREKFNFAKLPDLPIELTGLPKLRRFLFHQPADENLQALRYQVHLELGSYMEKINRVVNEPDREEGFKNIARDFQAKKDMYVRDFRDSVINFLLKETKISLSRSKSLDTQIKDRIRTLITKSWFRMFWTTFGKLLKEKGCITAGSPKATGKLIQGCDWNKELSICFEEVFKKWKMSQNSAMDIFRSVITNAIRNFYSQIHKLIAHAESEITAIEHARQKWLPYDGKMLVLAEALSNDIVRAQEQLLRRATMKDDRQNSVLPIITAGLFQDVLEATPAIKAGADADSKKYVTPLFRFKKDRLEELFLGEKNHILDRMVGKFQLVVDAKIREVVEAHVDNLSSMLQVYADYIRSKGPIDYEITPLGHDIRDALRANLPSTIAKQKRSNSWSRLSLIEKSRTTHGHQRKRLWIWRLKK